MTVAPKGTVMDVELLVVAHCPNELPTRDVLRDALDDCALSGIPIRVTVVRTQQEAERRGFIGSPTVRLDGIDPFSQPASPPAIACRVYRHAEGLSGTPPLAGLREAVRTALGNIAVSRDA
jgi:hypothetical protein